MRAWSIESVLRELERITRPPRRHDCAGDCSEAEEVSEPRQHPWGDSIPWPPEADLNYDTPNPTEPGLDDNELVGVRGLLQERYEDPRPKWLHDLFVATGEWVADVRRMRGGDAQLDCGHRYCERQGYGLCFGVEGAMADFIAAQNASAPVKSTPGTGAEPNSPADSSTAGDSGQPVDSFPPSPGCPRSDDAAAGWVGGAVPVITEVLTVHRVVTVTGGDGPYQACDCSRATCRGGESWRAHVAPLIADALAPQDNKPAFPQHTKHQPASSRSRYDECGGGPW